MSPAELLVDSGQLQTLFLMPGRSWGVSEQLEEEGDKKKVPPGIHRECRSPNQALNTALCLDCHSPVPLCSPWPPPPLKSPLKCC